MISELKATLKAKLVKDAKICLGLTRKVLLRNSSQFNTLILIEARYKKAKDSFNKGILEDDTHQITLNKIDASLLNLIDEISEENIDITKLGEVLELPSNPAPKNSTFGLGLTKATENRIIPPNKPTENNNATVPNTLFSNGGFDDFDDDRLKRFPWAEHSPLFIEPFDFQYIEQPIFSNYKEEIWSGVLENGVYLLSNKRDELAVKYHHLTVNEEEMAELATTVEVFSSNTKEPHSSCGLIFCFDPIFRTYYTFTISNDGQYRLWIRTKTGFKTIISGRSNLIQPNRFNELGFIKTAHHIYLYLNRIFIKKIAETTFQTGDSGLIAFGMGDFKFDNLAFYKI